MIEIPAIIENVRYRKDNFAILICSLNGLSAKYSPELEKTISDNIGEKYDTFIITTNMIRPEEKVEGRQCIFIGEFVKHPKFNVQFKSEFYYQDMPTDKEAFRAYLMSLPNIKEARSTDIINKFGVEGTIKILDENPIKLTEINGITDRRVPAIKAMWDRDKALRDLYIWLSSHDIPAATGKRIYEAWGNASKDVLLENPYKLTEIRGFGFETADRIAHKILGEVPLDYRMKACLEHTLAEDVRSNGNLCTPYSRLKDEVVSVLEKCDNVNSLKGDVNEYRKKIPVVIKANLNCFSAVKLIDGNNGTYIYRKKILDKERAIAKYLFDRNHHGKSKASCNDDDIDMAEKDLTTLCGKRISLDDCQKDAIKSAFNNKITVITGAGGTGKSSICRCIYYLAGEKGLSVRLMSPTGKASQVLSDKTKGEAATIHRSLKMMPDEDVGREIVTEDIIIVDEISMVGIDTLYPLLHAMEENVWANLILVGDANQLPSVSPGNFLHDIINSGCANVVSLKNIHRQGEKSYIPLIANEIALGKNVEIPKDATDIKWIEIDVNEFDKVLINDLEKFMEHHDIMELQILSPKYKGNCGVNHINEIIQQMMAKRNGHLDKYLKRDIRPFYLGDRVIQTQNNYDKQVFNGDIGNIIDLGRKVLDPEVSDEPTDFIKIKFYGDEYTYVGKEIDQISLAWTVTIHKYQGSQTNYIFFIMAREAEIMMAKELVYSGLTRAEKELTIYGHVDMLRLAPHRSVIRKRHTNVNGFIRELKENKKLLEVI
jgi:exodeoxyribonuclease V alpha subunit